MPADRQIVSHTGSPGNTAQQTISQKHERQIEWTLAAHEYRLRVYILDRGARMKTAKLFRNGQSQAVRLPKEFRLEGDEVYVDRVAGGVLLLPKKITYQQVMEILGKFRGRIKRSQPRIQERSWR